MHYKDFDFFQPAKLLLIFLMVSSFAVVSKSETTEGEGYLLYPGYVRYFENDLGRSPSGLTNQQICQEVMRSELCSGVEARDRLDCNHLPRQEPEFDATKACPAAVRRIANNLVETATGLATLSYNDHRNRSDRSLNRSYEMANSITDNSLGQHVTALGVHSILYWVYYLGDLRAGVRQARDGVAEAVTRRFEHERQSGATPARATLQVFTTVTRDIYNSAEDQIDVVACMSYEARARRACAIGLEAVMAGVGAAGYAFRRAGREVLEESLPDTPNARPNAETPQNEITPELENVDGFRSQGLPEPTDFLTTQESGAFWDNFSQRFSRTSEANFASNSRLRERFTRALRSGSPYGNFLRSVGYRVEPDGNIFVPSLNQVMNRYNAIMDDMVRRGVVSAENTIRPVLVMRDEAGNLRTLQIGDPVPRGWSIEESIFDGDTFMDILARGEMPVGSLGTVGRNDFLAADHDIVHLSAYARNPHIMAQVRQHAAQMRAAQAASTTPRAVHDRIFYLMEYFYYVPSSYRGRVRSFAPEVFNGLSGPQSLDTIQERLTALTDQEVTQLGQTLRTRTSGLYRNFGGVTADEVDIGYFGSEYGQSYNSLNADRFFNAYADQRESVAAVLMELWNGTHIDPRNVVRDIINPEANESGRMLQRIFCLQQRGRLNTGDSGFNCR